MRMKMPGRPRIALNPNQLMISKIQVQTSGRSALSSCSVEMKSRVYSSPNPTELWHYISSRNFALEFATRLSRRLLLSCIFARSALCNSIWTKHSSLEEVIDHSSSKFAILVCSQTVATRTHGQHGCLLNSHDQALAFMPSSGSLIQDIINNVSSLPSPLSISPINFPTRGQAKESSQARYF
ncbi:uncharacterized protein EI90DRAFT_2090779 [Cantharellus anzutake]|uniref:uncharacterized protein n=1 Tax=Cantharellus anzutake TaxID=1750568 RepID=UPI001904EC45|nr:uncharacterized protein EI90DRAFT_2090779 [Cantharellus anzutake]KAF8340633.1 hypothetical protein EI90DRAFT_2090779 [Cantharellus anzutake]